MDVNTVANSIQNQMDFMRACHFLGPEDDVRADPAAALDLVRGLRNGACMALILWAGLFFAIHG